MSEVNSTFTTQENMKAGGRVTRPSAVLRARQDRAARRTFFAITILPILLILLVTIALFVRALPILEAHSLPGLLLGEVWKPNNGQFGFLPFILGTVWVTIVGVILSVPPCLLASVYLAEYAHARTRAVTKPILDVLAAIPPVVYGVWGLIAIVPTLPSRNVCPSGDAVAATSTPMLPAAPERLSTTIC